MRSPSQNLMERTDFFLAEALEVPAAIFFEDKAESRIDPVRTRAMLEQ